MIGLKSGAQINNLDKKLEEQLRNIALLWKAFFPADTDGLTITSGCEGSKDDGVHKPSSLHYPENSPTLLGRAIDLRTFDVPKERLTNALLPSLRLLLGTDFDVVLEKDHIHLEYDPKGIIV